MNLDYELLQFFVYKKIVKRKDVDEIMEACKRLNMPVEKYLVAKEYCNEVSALYACRNFSAFPRWNWTCWTSTRNCLTNSVSTL